MAYEMTTSWISQLRMLHLDVGRRVAREEPEVCVHCMWRDASTSFSVPAVKDACSVKKKLSHTAAPPPPTLPQKGGGVGHSTMNDIGGFSTPRPE
jgi:hypothetical protein